MNNPQPPKALWYTVCDANNHIQACAVDPTAAIILACLLGTGATVRVGTVNVVFEVFEENEAAHDAFETVDLTVPVQEMMEKVRAEYRKRWRLLPQ